MYVHYDSKFYVSVIHLLGEQPAKSHQDLNTFIKDLQKWMAFFGMQVE